ncbi:helix-turn-helix domain-containing protein [Streptomyces albireticuli]|uniref:helix-turn-helix domain-containing protein n=1 Tax=Streptomyces albireticuli TaxID=1940 RepID=UPI0036CDCFF3
MANGRGSGRYGQSKVGWEFFGSELRLRREAAEFTQQELGMRVFCSGSYIGQFEAGIRKPQLEVAQRIDAVLETGGFFTRMCEELINNSPFSDYFAEAAYLEGVADTIQVYAPMFVPGLFQTADYARAVFLGGFPFALDGDIDNWVAARMERARLLEHPTTPMLWAVLDENVLRRKVGGAAVMREQLLHLASLVRRRRIGVQVLSYSAGAPALGGLLKLMTFTDAPPVAYGEGPMTGNLVDDPALVAKCGRLYDLVRASALSPEASLDLIQAAAEGCADEH